MKKIYTTLFLVCLLFVSNISLAQSFSWSTYGTGANSYSSSNLGTTMSVNANGSGAISGFPNYQSASGGYLSVGVDWSNKTTNVKYTITFSKPLVGILFLLYDVDQGTTWDDKVTITGASETSVAIYPTITRSTYNTVSGTNNNIIDGTTDNPTYLNSPAIVSFGANPVKSFTVTYTAGSSSQSNPAAQYIGIGTITYGTVLPIDLVSFKAEKRNGNADIKWEAENMINFSHFEVERSATGNGGFETIGTVSTGGLDKGSYSYTDINVQNRMSRACYRLKMVDFDGKFKYSAVMMVAFGTVAIDVRPTILSAGEAVRVNLAGANAAKYDVRLFDLGGRMIQQKNQVSGQVQLETSLLKKGIYILSITDGVTQNAYRVTVQ
jgi:hypothetical protein